MAIKILKNGKRKCFYINCMHCATEFTYTLEDVTWDESDDGNGRAVRCPVCDRYNHAYLFTLRETKRVKYI